MPAATFDPAKHPRGGAKNRGQFGRKGGQPAKSPTRAALLRRARDLEQQAAVLVGKIGKPGAGVTATMDAAQQARDLKKRAKALRARSAAMLRESQAARGAAGFDESKHPRGPDGRFISKAQVEEYKRAGNWPPKPITKPTRETPVRPKPAETPAPEQPKGVKAWRDADEWTVAAHARVLEIGKGLEAAEAAREQAYAAVQKAEYEHDLIAGKIPPHLRKNKPAYLASRDALEAAQQASLNANLDARIARAKATPEARKALYAPEGPAAVPLASITSLGGSGRDLTGLQAVRDGHEFFVNVAGKGSVVERRRIVVAEDTGGSKYSGRGWADPERGTVNVTENVEAGTVAHEYTHHVEYAEPQALADALTFRQLRQMESGEQFRPLNDLAAGRSGISGGYDADEEGFGDKFFSPYCGKRYKNNGSTEILTMGVQRLYEDPIGFAKDDPEYFQFTLATLRKHRSGVGG